MVWRNDRLPPHSSLAEANWKLAELEKEMRAQIEIAMRHVPRITHLETHMGFEGFKPEIHELLERLRKEYHLQTRAETGQLEHFSGWGREQTTAGRVQAFIANLEKLTPGTYLFVEHPAAQTPEMETVGHKGYEGVAADREMVRRVYTSPEVKAAIRRLGIELISYKDIRESR
jgi:predicted glycoside hydrolase/deacetylase ChbG (UPF0249 family)